MTPSDKHREQMRERERRDEVITRLEWVVVLAVFLIATYCVLKGAT